MRRATRPHVVFGVHFEKAKGRFCFQHFGIMLWLQANASLGRNGGRGTRMRLGRALQWFKRAWSKWRFHADAGAFWNQLPGIALIVDCRGAGAARAFSGLAVVLALEGDAVALFHVGSLCLWQGCKCHCGGRRRMRG